MLKDSGNRTELPSGAVRDMPEGRGRFDLLPPKAMAVLARHFEAGAKKYSPRNWEKGMPINDCINSALRHTCQYMEGLDDEDHLAAATWNLLAAIEMRERYGYKFE